MLAPEPIPVEPAPRNHRVVLSGSITATIMSLVIVAVVVTLSPPIAIVDAKLPMTASAPDP